MKKITNQLKTNLFLITLLTCMLSFGQSMATYTITFTGDWNSTDHSDNGNIMFPSNDHWSDLVGATHNSSVTFWEPGQMATQGIENVAETGSNSAFNSEVDDAITAGTADQWLQQVFSSPNNATGSATIMSITVSEDFPLLTLLTMVAPSPDWFAGIHGVSLRNGGSWETSLSIDLFPYDAGTEEGTEYDTSNSSTNPQENITSLVNVAPFNDKKVGTMTITLESVLSTPTNDFKSGISLSPNPSNGIISINNSTSEPINTIQIYDAIGKLVKTNEIKSTNSNLQLNLEDLNSGIYLVKLNSIKGKSLTKKLVIK